MWAVYSNSVLVGYCEQRDGKWWSWHTGIEYGPYSDRMTAARALVKYESRAAGK